MDYNKLKLEAIYELTHNRSEISDEFKNEYIKLTIIFFKNFYKIFFNTTFKKISNYGARS